ncbi:hypothetical protein WDV93_16785 [Pantoea ananatis]
MTPDVAPRNLPLVAFAGLFASILAPWLWIHSVTKLGASIFMNLTRFYRPDCLFLHGDIYTFILDRRRSDADGRFAGWRLRRPARANRSGGHRKIGRRSPPVTDCSPAYARAAITASAGQYPLRPASRGIQQIKTQCFDCSSRLIWSVSIYCGHIGPSPVTYARVLNRVIQQVGALTQWRHLPSAPAAQVNRSRAGELRHASRTCRQIHSRHGFIFPVTGFDARG